MPARCAKRSRWCARARSTRARIASLGSPRPDRRAPGTLPPADLDPVEQRAGHAGEVALHAERAAHAVAMRVAEVAAGTSPRCLFAMCGFTLKSRSLQPIRR